MQHVAAIFRRELAGYFGQPLAYIVLTLFMVLLALPVLFIDDVIGGGVASMKAPFFWIGVAFLFLAPALTMRLIAEERRTGSLELVTTLPITPTALVVGKWLAAVAMIAVALLMTTSFPIALGILGDLDPYVVIAGYLGMLLLGASLAAVGIAASALTRYQVLAFLLAFVITAIPFGLGYALQAVDVQYLGLVQYLTFEYHFANLARGVLDSRSLVFFGGIMVVSLRLAVWLLQAQRLR